MYVLGLNKSDILARTNNFNKITYTKTFDLTSRL